MEFASTSANQNRTVSTILLVSGIAMIAVGAALGLFVSGLGFILIAVGAIDILIARRFVPGRTGTIAAPDEGGHADPDLLARDAEADAVANPYSRED